MKLFKLLIFFMFIVFSANAWAYGSTTSTSSKKACKKPTLTHITPAHLATVQPEAKFSFQTSARTLPHSIKVFANKIPIEANIKATNSGFTVSSALPAAIKKKYVRIDFDATTTNSCQGVDGWLLKVEAVKP